MSECVRESGYRNWRPSTRPGSAQATSATNKEARWTALFEAVNKGFKSKQGNTWRNAKAGARAFLIRQGAADGRMTDSSGAGFAGCLLGLRSSGQTSEQMHLRSPVPVLTIHHVHKKGRTSEDQRQTWLQQKQHRHCKDGQRNQGHGESRQVGPGWRVEASSSCSSCLLGSHGPQGVDDPLSLPSHALILCIVGTWVSYTVGRYPDWSIRKRAGRVDAETPVGHVTNAARCQLVVAPNSPVSKYARCRSDTAASQIGNHISLWLSSLPQAANGATHANGQTERTLIRRQETQWLA